MLLLVDLLMEILPDNGCLIPFKKMEDHQKRNIILLTISHVEDLMLSLQGTEIDNGKYSNAH